jgi:hypothetical protein
MAQGRVRSSTTTHSMVALRELSLWAEQSLGISLSHRDIDVMLFISHPEVATTGATAPELARACGLAVNEVLPVMQGLAQAGLLQRQGPGITSHALAAPEVVADVRDASATRAAGAAIDSTDIYALPNAAADPGAVRFFATPALLAAWLQFEERVDGSLISRRAVRAALLLNKAPDAGLAALVDRVFDRFHDLGWLYLHNWGASCYLMASLLSRALQLEGHRTRVQAGYVELVKDERHFTLGGKGLAQPGQIDGHAFCVVDDGLLLDFGLGSARRSFRRDMFWAIAVPYQPGAEVVASVSHSRVGSLSWRIDWQSPRGEVELRQVQGLLDELMRAYPQRGLGVSAGDGSRKTHVTGSMLARPR